VRFSRTASFDVTRSGVLPDEVDAYLKEREALAERISSWRSPTSSAGHSTGSPARSLERNPAHEARLRVSSCRIHSTTRFQLALFWSTNYKSLILNG
jgi:hypothetical protein